MAQSNACPPKSRKMLATRRLTLLASVGILGMAILLSGPGSSSWIHPASAATQTTETTEQPVGFADLVARVKPAVVSVACESTGQRMHRIAKAVPFRS